MKILGRTFTWLGLPVLLAVGCAERGRDASVSYSPALTDAYPATSDRAEARAYPQALSGAEVTSTPPGATQQDWVLAEEIRALLTQNQKLGKAPMAAVVNNGVVTLRGGVRNEKERQALREQISQLPGVQRVEDEMEHKNPLGIGPGETKSY